jgi:outer membrane protein
MNNKIGIISLSLNGLLIIAVGVLYFLQFGKGNAAGEETTTDSTKTTKSEPLPEIRTVNGGMAFVDFEKLMEEYQFRKDRQKAFERDYEKKKAELDAKQRQLEADFMKYQQEEAGMAEGVKRIRQEALTKQEQDLYVTKDKLERELIEKDENFSKEFLKRLDDYLKTLSKEKNYSYVFTYQRGGAASIVYANDTLDITNVVIKGLNAEYRAKK